MTTQTQVPIREYTATVIGVAKQPRNEGWALSLEARPNMKYPDVFYGKDWGLVNNLKAGQRYTFLFRRDRLKDKRPEGSSHWWDYYEQLIEVRPPSAAPSPAPAQAPAPAEAMPANQNEAPWPDAEGGSEKPKERNEWKQPKGEFRTPEQIIRTYALESATALAVALIAKDAAMQSAEVMLVASKYAAFIANGTLPKQPEGAERSRTPEVKGESHA